MSASPTADAQRLSLPRVLAFACTSLPLSALAIAVSVHLPNYFAANIGVPLTVVAAAFATTRLIDIPVDPLLGLAQDRTRTPWGRYRIWTLIGAPILCIALYALFMSPHGATTTYLIAWLLVMYLGSSILTLSHSAWATTLATNYHERSRIFAVMTAVGILGAAAVLLGLALGLGRGKKQHDKRAALRERDVARETARTIAVGRQR